VDARSSIKSIRKCNSAPVSRYTRCFHQSGASMSLAVLVYAGVYGSDRRLLNSVQQPVPNKIMMRLPFVVYRYKCSLNDLNQRFLSWTACSETQQLLTTQHAAPRISPVVDHPPSIFQSRQTVHPWRSHPHLMRVPKTDAASVKTPYCNFFNFFLKV
jgi:hypothetical protein